ncbi:hypothetical protein, conserved [Eimeria praecox]|uniref:Uncharacterized protein n=1 Tax=Eimeria praecox TaxID=51316 RepID=U6GYH9_9EIME|nr:hypothetical protein, conserved [Eimeria praecox]
MALLLSSGEASHLRADEHRNGRSYENSLHMQIASDPPVRSAVDTLNCVLGESEKAIRRNRDINCGAGNVETMDANALMEGEASKQCSAASTTEQQTQVPDRSEAAGRTSQQLLRDRIEILGDEATLEEVERKGKKAKASRKNKRPKKRGNESCKGECSIEEKVEDQRAEEEAEEEERESAPVKALHKVEHAVKSPFSSSDEHAIFSDSSEDAGISEDNFEGSMEDPDEEGAAPTATFAASNGEKDDDDEDGDRESSGSAEFNNKEPESANRKKKINDSEEGEDEGGVGKGASKNPVEATQEEAEQAKTLQRPQGMHPQQSFCCMKSRYGTNSTGPSSPHHSSGIHAAIESARSRFAAARKAASSTSSVDEDFEEEPSTPELTDEEEQPAGNSELARAENTVGTMSKQGALATEATKEMEATEGISTTEEEAARTQASPGEDHKLAAAAEEAQQAEKGLKICAHGSFLSCRQGQRRHSLR